MNKLPSTPPRSLKTRTIGSYTDEQLELEITNLVLKMTNYTRNIDKVRTIGKIKDILSILENRKMAKAPPRKKRKTPGPTPSVIPFRLNNSNNNN